MKKPHLTATEKQPLKHFNFIFSIVLAVALIVCPATTSHAAGIVFVIDEVSDHHTVGDFEVFGSAGPYNAIFQLNLPFDFMTVSPAIPSVLDFTMIVNHVNADGEHETYALITPGVDYTLLRFKQQGALTQANSFDGSPFDTSPNGDISIADLQAALSAAGVVSTNTLNIGLDIDQDSDFIEVQAFSIKILDGTYDTTYSFHKDFVRVYDPLRPSPVPEPTSFLLFGFGLLGLYFKK